MCIYNKWIEWLAHLCFLGRVPGPTGEWIEELTEKPQHVTVTVLSSTTALTSWTASHESSGNSTIVSVLSLTCQKQKESQRLEKHYCTEVRSRSWGVLQPSKKPCCCLEPRVCPRDLSGCRGRWQLIPSAAPREGHGCCRVEERAQQSGMRMGLSKWYFCWTCCDFTQACATMHL